MGRWKRRKWKLDGQPLLDRLLRQTRQGKGAHAECMESVLSVQTGGYPQVKYQGKNRLLTHVVFELMHGRPVAEGKQINHHCDNRRCINPEHIYEGTQAENMADAVKRGRMVGGGGGGGGNAANFGGPLPGEQNPSSKLTTEQVLEIRRRHAEGGILQQALAEEYGVTPMAISYIVRYKKWKHV